MLRGMSIRRFVRLLRDPRLQSRNPTVDTSLAKTARATLHACSSGPNPGMFTSTGAVYKHIAEGHKNYSESFKKEKG